MCVYEKLAETEEVGISCSKQAQRGKNEVARPGVCGTRDVCCRERDRVCVCCFVTAPMEREERDRHEPGKYKTHRKNCCIDGSRQGEGCRSGFSDRKGNATRIGKSIYSS